MINRLQRLLAADPHRHTTHPTFVDYTARSASIASDLDRLVVGQIGIDLSNIRVRTPENGLGSVQAVNLTDVNGRSVSHPVRFEAGDIQALSSATERPASSPSIDRLERIQRQAGCVLSNQLAILPAEGPGTIVAEIMVLAIDSHAGLPGAFVVEIPRDTERSAWRNCHDGGRLPLRNWYFYQH